MKFKEFTLKYSERPDGFNTEEIEGFSRDKDMIEIRDYFFMSNRNPCLTRLGTSNSDTLIHSND